MRLLKSISILLLLTITYCLSVMFAQSMQLNRLILSGRGGLSGQLRIYQPPSMGTFYTEIDAADNITPGSHTYKLPQYLPAASNSLLASTSTGTLSWTGLTGSVGVGGGVVVAGQCSTGTGTVTGATTSMTVIASPTADPTSGGTMGVSVLAYVSALNTVTVTECSMLAGTLAGATYNVRVI